MSAYLKKMLVCVLVGTAGLAFAADTKPVAACANPVYLTVDPGRMEFAPRIADVLRRSQVKAAFFVSNLGTRNGEALGDQWGSWWKVAAEQGHELVSQTYDHLTWHGDLPGYKPAFRMGVGSGAFAGREFTFDPPKYCEQISHAADRVAYFTGKKPLPLFHAPGGRASSKLVAAANACGYAHVGATGAGHLTGGVSLKAAIGGIRSGDVLVADLNATGGAEPWAVANLEPLIAGLKERGLCFESLRNHPNYKDWIANHGG